MTVYNLKAKDCIVTVKCPNCQRIKRRRVKRHLRSRVRYCGDKCAKEYTNKHYKPKRKKEPELWLEPQ